MDPATQTQSAVDPGLASYFRVEIDYSQATPFRWIIHEWLLSFTSEIM